MASRRDPARDSRWVSTTADGRLGGDVADSLSQGVFILRKAPTVTKRVTARKSFFPLVPDETHEGMERRRDAYRACWAAADAHVSRVLAEANAEAFEKLEAFVKARFAERAEMRRANGGVVPQHAAQLIPVGLVLAGGVNSDDHEETFTKLTHHLRETGCHTALLRSRDLRARGAGGAAAAAAAAAGANESGPAVIAGASGGGGGGGGGGGLGVATRHILAQLRAGAGAGADATRVSGRSVRHLKRWYREVTEEDEPIDRSEAETEKTEKTEKDGNGNGNGVAAAGTREGEGPARTLRARTSLSGAGAVAGGVTGAPVAPAPAPVPVPVPAGAIPRKTRARPVVIVVEDTEGFDTRVLADLLLALSDAGDVLPVCVLLGVATSTAMMHGMIPAAVAARLRPESFRLWSPRSIMTAVQERVLLDPGRAPALSNAALELIMTRFKEHDFSLSAARRAMHLLTLDHFMTQPLSALATAAVAAADAYAEADGDGDGDAWNFVDTPSECLANVDADVAAIASRASRITAEAATAARAAATAACDELLTPKSLHWARKNLGAREGRRWVPEDPEEARAAIADALADAYFARRRWALALRCVAVAAAAVGLRGDKAELANLIVDASSVKWMASDVSGGEGTDEGDEGTSQGEKLVRTVCGRLERGEAGAEGLKRLLARWRRIVALDPETHAEHGAFLAETDVSDGDDAKGADEGADEDVDVVRERERENGAARAESAEPETGPEGDSADVKNADPGASPRRDTETNPPDTTRASEPPGDAPVPVPGPASAASDPAPVPVPGPDPAASDPAPVPVPGPDPAASDPSPLASPDGAAAVAAALRARRSAGPQRARALEIAAAERGKGTRRRDDTAANADKKEHHLATGDDRPAANSDDAVGNDAPARAAAFLRAMTRARASRPPASLRAHELFCVGSTTCLRQAVQAAPRLALEQTMATPRGKLRCGCCPAGGGPATSLPDTCAAYNLLQDHGENANVHEWFRTFCELHEPPDSGAGRRGVRARGMKSVAGSAREEGDAEGDKNGVGAGAAGEKGTESGTEKGTEKGTFGLEKRRCWELQARFTRAAAELEFLGVARPVKRRKVEYMQRTAFPLDQLLGESR